MSYSQKSIANRPTPLDSFDTGAKTVSERPTNPNEDGATASEKPGKRPKGFIIHLKGLTEEQASRGSGEAAKGAGSPDNRQARTEPA